MPIDRQRPPLETKSFINLNPLIDWRRRPAVDLNRRPILCRFRFQTLCNNLSGYLLATRNRIAINWNSVYSAVAVAVAARIHFYSLRVLVAGSGRRSMRVIIDPSHRYISRERGCQVEQSAIVGPPSRSQCASESSPE